MDSARRKTWIVEEKGEHSPCPPSSTMSCNGQSQTHLLRQRPSFNFKNQLEWSSTNGPQAPSVKWPWLLVSMVTMHIPNCSFLCRREGKAGFNTGFSPSWPFSFGKLSPSSEYCSLLRKASPEEDVSVTLFADACPGHSFKGRWKLRWLWFHTRWVFPSRSLFLSWPAHQRAGPACYRHVEREKSERMESFPEAPECAVAELN